MPAKAAFSPPLACKVIACGAWGPGFTSCQELATLFNDVPATNLPDESALAEQSSGPKPTIIPANERRRAPLPVRLAIEASLQACQQAGIDPKALRCVFVSGLGDTQLTDYMCKVLATDNKQLSPTKFHNSVHNAAAGYWTISTGCEQAANSVAGFQESVPLALMEAIVQCNQEAVPILVTFYDAPVAEVLTDILGNGSAFSFSMVIAPIDSHFQGQQFSLQILPEQGAWPQLQSQHALLQWLYSSSPSGRILGLFEKYIIPALTTEKALVADEDGSALVVPLGKGTSLQILAEKWQDEQQD